MIAVAILGGVCLVVYGCFFGGPSLRIGSGNGKVHIDTRFLGEYDLGLTKLVITDSGGATVLRLDNPDGSINGVFFLAAGTNSVAALDGRDTGPFVPQPRDAFVLERHHRYKIRVCGNNGFARTRCSRRGFSL